MAAPCSASGGVPRLVWQTWKSAVVPAHWAASPVSIARHMPSWKYTLLTDADNAAFMRTHFPELAQWFNDLRHPIQRADVIRYAVLYVHGGLYLDLDIVLKAPLDDLFASGDGPFLLKAPRNLAGHFTNFIMASAPRNAFWLTVLAECRRPLQTWQTLLPHLRISQETGLGAVSRAVAAWPRPISLLPSHVLVPCTYCNPDDGDKPYFYLKFTRGQSWCGWDTAVFNAVLCNPDVVALVLLAVALLALSRRRLKDAE